MAGSLTIASTLITSQQGNKTIGPLTISAANPIGQITDSAFAGAQSNTIAVPVGSTAVVICPPVGNLVGLTLKGVAGDTGIKLFTNQPSVIALDSTVVSFVLTSLGAISGTVELSFF